MFTIDELLEKQYPHIAKHDWFNKPTLFFLRYLLKEKEIKRFIEHFPHLNGIDFVDQILEYFHFSYSSLDREKENIPAQGRVLIIANHPIGSLDGLALIKLVSEVRHDIKVVAHEAMLSIKPLECLLLAGAKKINCLCVNNTTRLNSSSKTKA